MLIRGSECQFQVNGERASFQSRNGCSFSSLDFFFTSLTPFPGNTLLFCTDTKVHRWWHTVIGNPSRWRGRSLTHSTRSFKELQFTFKAHVVQFLFSPSSIFIHLSNFFFVRVLQHKQPINYCFSKISQLNTYPIVCARCQLHQNKNAIIQYFFFSFYLK